MVVTLFCVVTVMVVVSTPCSASSKGEEVFDTLILVVRNLVQFGRLFAIMRKYVSSRFLHTRRHNVRRISMLECFPVDLALAYLLDQNPLTCQDLAQLPRILTYQTRNTTNLIIHDLERPTSSLMLVADLHGRPLALHHRRYDQSAHLHLKRMRICGQMFRKSLLCSLISFG